MAEKIDLLKLLEEGKSVSIEPIGTSMYPLFIERKDRAIVVPVSLVKRKLKRSDVCVYISANGKLVIHRIFKTTKDGYYFVGDHQVEIEGPVPKENVKGLMVGFVRRGKEFSAQNVLYIALSRVWLFIRPIRLKLIKIGSFVKRCIN